MTSTRLTPRKSASFKEGRIFFSSVKCANRCLLPHTYSNGFFFCLELDSTYSINVCLGVRTHTSSMVHDEVVLGVPHPGPSPVSSVAAAYPIACLWGLINSYSETLNNWRWLGFCQIFISLQFILYLYVEGKI